VFLQELDDEMFKDGEGVDRVGCFGGGVRSAEDVSDLGGAFRVECFDDVKDEGGDPGDIASVWRAAYEEYWAGGSSNPAGELDVGRVVFPSLFGGEEVLLFAD